jgi:hypothetical protein
VPIATAVGSAMRGWRQPNRATRTDLAGAVAELQFADLFRGSGTIAEEGSVRIDVQGPWTQGPGKNIQAQVGSTSIAGLLIANTLGTAAGAVNQNAVLGAARTALIASAGDGSFRQVTGTQP